MMMMKDVKDEGKQMSPLFPRLHVNDREKGGPRAPPRNKMALYEQLSIPLQKFSSTSVSPSPPASQNGASSASPARPKSSGAYQINLLTPTSSSPVKYLSGKRDVTTLGIKLTPTQEKGNPKTAITTHFGASKMLHSSNSSANPTFLERMKCDKAPVWGERIREDDAVVLELAKLTPITYCDDWNEKLSERNPCSNLGSSSQKQSCLEKKAEPAKPGKNQCRMNSQDTVSNEHEMCTESLGPRETSDPALSARVASNASSSPSHGNSRCKPPKRPHESATLECMSKSSGASPKLPRIKGPLQDSHSFRKNETSVRGDATSVAKSENKTDHDTREGDGKSNEAQQCDVKATKRCQFPDMVIAESASVIGILPDDVVGAIGEKLFWKTRRAMIDQQRVFGVQVFELHRLIKVQKLLSRSPDLLISCGLGTLKPPAETVRTIEAPPERPFESSWKDQTSGNPPGKPPTAKIPLSPINSDIRKDLFAKRPEQMAYPMCYPAAGNHWLVPVMSPSEGLLYKPYIAPCPPISGEFMAPVYGGCGPISGGPTLRDPSAAFGIPSSHHHQGFGLNHSYFPPISLPVMNPTDSRFSIGEANLSQFNPPSSHNVSTQVSKVVSVSKHGSKSQKFRETQGSAGSSPMDPTKGASTLLLFPVEQPSDQAAVETQSSDRPGGSVIKVVPHNRKSASESAARIFRSIQEERGRRD
ncbi:hypothetical protein MLD38_004851 [Melastoma candidum]|uniref:Uncharacterized protein n=1 Tax=Melastoma candidum TaxID=119954 RepID=A0ACB9S8X5_9MYRT|nr:hypothetical protein MLD38_004851 [Melastoma candidum]